MRSNQEPERDERMSSLLRDWRLNTPLPAGFNDQVWERIARAEAQPKPGLWAGFLRLIEEVLPQPKVALGYVCLLLALGATAGSLVGQAQTSRLDSELRQRYVQSIDPYRSELPIQ